MLSASPGPTENPLHRRLFTAGRSSCFPFPADETLILALLVFLVAFVAGTDTSRNCRVVLIAADILAVVPFFRSTDAVW
jgi:hypothetical protein